MANLIQQAETVCNDTTVVSQGINDASIKRAKQARFTLSARLLSKKPINVGIIDNPNECAADYDTKTKLLRLNEGVPKASTPIEALIYDRAKLYHELGHANWTKAGSKRRELAQASGNPDFFMGLSNVLEDGRIERLLSMKWPGSKSYLTAFLAEYLRDAPSSPMGSLVLYVRAMQYRNAEEKAFWQPYQDKIDKAIKAKTTAKVCEIAAEITDAIYGKKQEQEQQPQPEPQQDSGEQGSQGDQQEQQRETGEQSQPEPQQEQEQEQEQQSSQIESEAEGESEAEKPNNVDSDVWEKVKQMAETAKHGVANEVNEAWEAILQEAQNYEPEQEYANDNESAQAYSVAALFESLLTENNRPRFHEARGGLLNSLSLPSALTSRRCFHAREQTPNTPYVALLLDISGSMEGEARNLTSAARIIQGALLMSKVNVLTLTYETVGGIVEEKNAEGMVITRIDYKNSITRYSTIPKEPLKCTGGTPTGAALQVANDWLEEKGATRSLVIVITDGSAGDRERLAKEFKRCENMGGFVLGVVLKYDADTLARSPAKRLTESFSDYCALPEVSELAHLLEPRLASFLAG